LQNKSFEINDMTKYDNRGKLDTILIGLKKRLSKCHCPS